MACVPHDLPARPYVKPWYRVAETPSGLVLEYAERVVTFEGRAARRLLPAVLPLLDGSRSLPELVAAAGDAARDSLHAVLALLARHGLLTEGPPVGSAGARSVADTASFVAAASGDGRSPGAVAARLVASRFAVAGAGTVAAEAARLLGASGAGSVERLPVRGLDPDDVTLTIVAPAAPELGELAAWNGSALAARRPWLLALPFNGRYAAVGPLFVPGHTGCWECFRLRRLAGLEYDAEFWALERSAPPARAPASLDAAVAGLAVTVTLVFAAGSALGLVGGLHALEAGPTLGLAFHRLLRVPRCPACSGLADTAPPLPWFKLEAVDVAA